MNQKRGKYKPEIHKPDMRDMTVIAKSKSGKSQVFLYGKNRRTYTRKELCIGINNGEVVGGHIRVINGNQVPCRNKSKV